jgi:L-aspartate oxidase
MNDPYVIIVGSGVAALQLARQLQDAFHVMIITKEDRRKSNSFKAQGGIAAAIAKKDNINSHVKDTLEAGCYHQQPEAVRSLISDGKRIIQRLIQEGAPFDRNEDGSLSLGMEGAHSRNRILHCGGDQTGKILMKYLLENLSGNVHFVEGEMVYELIKNNEGRCIGVKTRNTKEETKHYYAPYVVLATGGIGGLYSSTSNDSTITGDGVAMAFLAGAKLTDMEFVQFHPTLLFVKSHTKGLISEAVRGEGAQLVNDRNDRIMETYPLKELAPRHLVAQKIFEERQKGREVFLTISNIADFEIKFPSITKLCLDNDISIKDGKIPVAPGCHFMMGGILINDVGATTVEGLYAIGETAASGVHGANRLASNSLLEGLVYGERLACFIKNSPYERVPTIVKQDDCFFGVKEIPFTLEEFKSLMMRNVGIIRSESSLNIHWNWLQSKQLSLVENLGSMKRIDIQKYFMWVIGMCITTSALLRTESRGGHIRSDYPDQDLAFFKKKINIERIENEIRGEICEQIETEIYA